VPEDFFFFAKKVLNMNFPREKTTRKEKKKKEEEDEEMKPGPTR
jgi:hypothetical protein